MMFPRTVRHAEMKTLERPFDESWRFLPFWSFYKCRLPLILFSLWQLTTACSSGTVEANCADEDQDQYPAVSCGGTDCDDQNPAVHTNAEELCNGMDDNCDGQTDEGCQGCQDSQDCDDLVDCTVDNCDSVTGTCQHLPDNTRCDDSIACTGDSCDVTTGTCRHTPDNSICADDGLFCNGVETCDPSSPGHDPVSGCVSSGDPCPAGPECARDCNETAGNCFDVVGTSCGSSQDTFCTQPDTCDGAGVCQGNDEPLGTACNDDLFCNGADTCDGQGNCSNHGGDPCGGQQCNEDADQCGSCIQDEDCDDHIDCTVDSCDQASGICSHISNHVLCDDTLFCTGTERCDPHALESDPVTGCVFSQNPCTGGLACNQTCNEDTATCFDPDGSSCDDGYFCNGIDSCDGQGLCANHTADPCANGLACNNACSEDRDSCQAQSGDSCDDGNFCNGADSCDGQGICSSHAGDPCANGSLCNRSCNENTDDCFDPNGSACSDGDPCTNDQCDGQGFCVHPPAQVEVIPFSLGPGLRRLVGNGQTGPILPGPVGSRLPTPLVVQLNESAGCTQDCAPISGQTITFEIWAVSHPATEDPRCSVSATNLCTCGYIDAGHSVCADLGITCARCSNYCYGKEQFFASSNPSVTLYSSRVCNNVDGLLVNLSDNSTASMLQVTTDQYGQAAVGLQLPNRRGMTVVRAYTDNGQEVKFFAGAVAGLGSTLTVPCYSSNCTGATPQADPQLNPALGPARITKTNPSGDERVFYYNFLKDWRNYSISFTALSTTTGEVNNVPSAPLDTKAGIDQLTISLNYPGMNPGTDCALDDNPCFGTAGNNIVRVGGVLANIASESQTSLTVDIPEGIPGASSIMVSDGSFTTFYDWSEAAYQGSGSIASRAVAVANFWRVAPKPIFINAYTNNRLASRAHVKVLARDLCGRLQALPSSNVTLIPYNPDKTIVSNAVLVESGPDANGVATVKGYDPPDTNAGTVRSAFLVATVLGVSSDALADGSGNTTVTAVPHMKNQNSLDHWSAYNGPNDNNLNGENAFIERGGDENPSNDMTSLNPAAVINSIDSTGYTAPDGQPDECFDTEKHIAVISISATGLPGNAGIINVGVDGSVAAAGTAITVCSGSPLTSDSGVIGSTGKMGMNAFAALSAYLAPSGQTASYMDLNAGIMAAALSHTTIGNQPGQLLESFGSDIAFLAGSPDTFRNTIFYLVFKRTLPIDAEDVCP